MKFELPKLPYDYDSLEPHIDSETMHIHHDKHHKGYVDKLNKALENHSELKDKTAKELIKDPEKLPSDSKTAIMNNGGGHVNHTFFWKILKKDVEFKGDIADKIKEEFGSFDNFKEKFSEKAESLFGSGWTWLVLDKDKLKIINTSGHENPISKGLGPLLVLDVWEHAYYLKYQNKRKEFIDAFFNIINWEEVEKNYGAKS